MLTFVGNIAVSMHHQIDFHIFQSQNKYWSNNKMKSIHNEVIETLHSQELNIKQTNKPENERNYDEISPAKKKKNQMIHNEIIIVLFRHHLA